MPLISGNTPKYKPRKPIVSEWPTFRRGLNLLLRATELGNEEMTQADNIMLIGSGVPTGRWGTTKYFTVGETGSNRGFGKYATGTNRDLLALSDEGFIRKKDGTSSTIIEGQSYPSGSIIRSEQLGGEAFFVSENVPLTKYNGTELIPYATISAPTGIYATNVSGVTGGNRISYKVVANAVTGGQTNAVDNYVLENVPYDLSQTRIDIFWNAVSAPTIASYEIYRGTEGDEAFIASVDGQTTTYSDFGDPSSAINLFPTNNTTGGVKSKMIAKYKDRLLMVDEKDPTLLLISGRYPYHTTFSYTYGGGSVYIDPDGGEDITGIAVQPIADRIIVFKDTSSYIVELSTTQVGNYLLLTPEYQPLSTSIGCSSQDAIATVENDTFYFGRNGLYVVGYEPNFLNILRTNEISARIRPYLELLNEDDYKNANAEYINNKYLLSFPNRREIVCYDRERGCFAGVWKFPFGISHMTKFIDNSGTENWVIGSSESAQVYTFKSGIYSDDGQSISKVFRTNKEDFGDWTLLTVLNYFYMLFGNVTGETNVSIIAEDRTGNQSVIKSFTISGSDVAGLSGYGIGSWGEYPYGETDNAYSASTNEITRWGTLFKQIRLVQVEVSSNVAGTNFEVLAIKMTANKQTEGSLSSSQRI